jgi:hypothetical protein
MEPDQTALMHRLVLIHAGREPIMLVLSWRGSYIVLPAEKLRKKSFLMEVTYNLVTQ